ALLVALLAHPSLRGVPRTPLVPFVASAAAVDFLRAEEVRAASAPTGRRRSGRGKGGHGGGGGSGGGGSGGGGGGGGGGGSGGGSGGVGGGGGGSGSGGGNGSGGGSSGGGRGGAVQRGGSSGGQRQQQQCPSETPTPHQFCGRAGQRCGMFHTQHRCFSRLDDAFRAEFPDATNLPRWLEHLRQDVDIFALNYNALLAAMYALPVSAEGDCYLCMPPDPCIEAAALGASESALPSTLPAEALHTFTLDSGASRYFFCDNTTVSPLPAPVVVRLADPSGGPVLARSSTILPCFAVPSSSLSGLHLPSFSTNVVAASTSASGQLAAPCSCCALSHQTLLWHHRLGHPSLPRLHGMHSRLLVSGLPRSLPPLPPLPAPPCLPCVEGRQCAAPHSSFPLTIAPLQTLHMDVGGEFAFDLLRDFCRGEGITQSFTLPASPQQNGVAERRIDLVMEVACTSMIHAATPHFLWSFAVRLAMRRCSGSGDLVPLSADKLSSRSIPCVFLGFPPDARGWQFDHPTSRRVLPSQDVTFEESVPFYRFFPYRTAPLPPTQLFLAPGPPPIDPLPPQGPAPSVVSQRGVRGGAERGGAEPKRAELGGAESKGAEPGVFESGGAEPDGTDSAGGPTAASSRRELLGAGGPAARDAAAGGTGAGGARASRAGGTAALGGARTGGTGAARAGGAATAGGAGGAGAAAAGGAGGAGGTGAAGAGGAAGARAGDPAAGGAGGGGARGVGTGAGGTGRPRPYFVPLVRQVLGLPCSTDLPPRQLCPQPDQSQSQLQPASPLPAPSPYTEQTGGLTERREPASCPALPVCAVRTGRRVPCQRPSSVPRVSLCRLLLRPLFLMFLSLRLTLHMLPLVDFSAACRLDYAASLVDESESVCPPSVGGECALGTDVLEDRQEDFDCFAAVVPHLVSMLVAPEGDPDAPDIPTPRSYLVAISRPYSQWQTTMDAEMASWKSTGTYVDVVPSPEANIVDDMWIFRGSLHEEIWLRRPLGFTGSFPPGTQWSLRRPVYGLRQAPREWHDTLRTTLAALAFAPSTADPSLFLCTDTLLPPFYILVYVDDLVFATADTEGLALVNLELQKRHMCIDLVELRSYLGLQITWDRARRTITLTQSHMVQQVLQRFRFQYSSPQSTPLPTGHLLSAKWPVSKACGLPHVPDDLHST
ncbi:unnamed protein product, partial [Closterium sp. NIES-53]